jgi:hypothetical protein
MLRAFHWPQDAEVLLLNARHRQMCNPHKFHFLQSLIHPQLPLKEPAYGMNFPTINNL